MMVYSYHIVTFFNKTPYICSANSTITACGNYILMCVMVMAKVLQIVTLLAK